MQRWFVKHRGFASGLAVSGIGVGTLVMPPLASLLIELGGWRYAYLVLGGLATVVGVGMALLIENDPQARGSAPMATRRARTGMGNDRQASPSARRSGRGGSSACMRPA